MRMIASSSQSKRGLSPASSGSVRKSRGTELKESTDSSSVVDGSTRFIQHEDENSVASRRAPLSHL